MAKEHSLKFKKDLSEAIVAVMKNHGLGQFTVQANTDVATKVLTLTIAPFAPVANAKVISKNAAHRYTASMHTLGLPSLGTKISLASGQYKIGGLSSDCKRVKTTSVDNPGKVVDLPLEIVAHHFSTAAAKQVTAIDATDDVESVGEAAAVLAELFKKPAA